MRYMWHATPFENLISIMENGIEPGPDGLVYMCEQQQDAAKFVRIRGCRHILVVKIKILKKDEDKVHETYDHSESFFKCKAFGYKGHIDTSKIVDYRQYKL